MNVRAAVALLVAGLAAPVAAQAPGRLEVSLRPDTVTVGQPFTVTLHVRAAPGATVTFPPGPDSTGWVQALDPRAVAQGAAGDSVDRTATYRLAAWNVGGLPLNLPDVHVTLAGKTTTLSTRGLAVFVKSVLPDDSSKRVPKPARALFVGWAFPWWVLVVLALIAFVAWITRRRRRREEARRPPPTPFERAEREFTRIAALGLVEAGERGRYLSLMIEVLRDYLQARFPLASLSLTADEVVHELTDAATVPGERLAALLREADLVKFARRGLTTDRALELGREARAIVVHEHVASTPPADTEAA